MKRIFFVGAVLGIVFLLLFYLMDIKKELWDSSEREAVVNEEKNDEIEQIDSQEEVDSQEEADSEKEVEIKKEEKKEQKILKDSKSDSSLEKSRWDTKESLSSEESGEDFSKENEIDQKIDEILDKMTLEEKTAQLLVVLPESLTGVGHVVAAGEVTKNAISQYPVGGIIYMETHVVSEYQFIDMVKNIQSFSEERIGIPLLICIDEEGGRVRRISGKGIEGVPEIPSMYEIGSTKDAQEAYRIGCKLASYLERFQVNTDFAPVADVFSNENNTVIGTRSFGNDAALVADMVEQEVRGLQENHISATLKHFPGHGDTAEDSHLGGAYSYKTLEELRECEFLPFQAGIDAGADFVMMGHISLPNVLGEDIPSSLSHRMVTEILREELGFQGIVITDAMNMAAITSRYSSAEAAVLALKAGVDIILEPSDFRAAYQGVLEAVENGDIEEERIDESVRRILGVKLGNS